VGSKELLNSSTTSSTPMPPKAADSTSSQDISGEPSEEESKCPMHKKDGSYSYDWRAMFRPNFPHGPGSEKPMSEEEAKAKITRRASVMDPTMASPGGGGCPVQHKEYNVYSQPIDPTNNMPQNANQLPAPEQSAELSTHRVKSNIPKGGASDGSTWTYPSPQMFYNALARKGKLDDTSEEEIDSVVALHNNMNEKTWNKVLEWERAVASNDESPKLLKFMGRPKDLSPKAWIKHNLLGHPLPFDRHDWTVVRSDGTTVRYIIDYYYDDTRAQTDGGGMPQKDDLSATPSLLVDVRPALDGPSTFLDRAVKMPYAILSGQSQYERMPLSPTTAMRNQVEESIDVWKSIQMAASGKPRKSSDEDSAPKLSDTEIQRLTADFAKALADCKKAQERVNQCQSDDECGKASLDLTMCMGKNMCSLQHKTLITSLSNEAESSSNIDTSLERLSECVLMKTAQYESIQQARTSS